MLNYIGVHTICDTDKADGNVHFEKDYLEFKPRDYDKRNCGFKLYYKDIKDINGYKRIKGTVSVILNDGKEIRFYMYKMDTFIALVNSGREACNVLDVEPNSENSQPLKAPLTDEQLDKLAKLNDLRKEGVLSDQEFEEEKKLILNRK